MEKVEAYKSLDGLYYGTEKECKDSDLLFELGEYVSKLKLDNVRSAHVYYFFKDLKKDKKSFKEICDLIKKYEND